MCTPIRVSAAHKILSFLNALFKPKCPMTCILSYVASDVPTRMGTRLGISDHDVGTKT